MAFVPRRALVSILLLLCSSLLLISKRRGIQSHQSTDNSHSSHHGNDILQRQQRRRRLKDSLGHFHRLFNDDQAQSNALEINKWRREFDTKCVAPDQTKEQVTQFLKQAFKPSRLKHGTHEDGLPIEACQYTFLDLGANVGETLGKLIDAGLPTCSKKRMYPSRYDLKTGHVGTTFYGAVRNPLVVWLASTLQNVSRYPESYCYFGMEGNPLFTDLLRLTERQVMRTFPRPVRRSHFFTGSVVTDKDGPTTLYLDTVNVKQNFRGSSLLATHLDVETSKETNSNNSNDTTIPQSPVEGYTLSTLLEHTVIHQSGSHAIIKMDVEGAEYQVFEECVPMLCNFTKAGVRIDLLIAVHDTEILGDDNQTVAAMELYRLNKIKALECGVNLYEGDYGQ